MKLLLISILTLTACFADAQSVGTGDRQLLNFISKLQGPSAAKYALIENDMVFSGTEASGSTSCQVKITVTPEKIYVSTWVAGRNYPAFNSMMQSGLIVKGNDGQKYLVSSTGELGDTVLSQGQTVQLLSSNAGVSVETDLIFDEGGDLVKYSVVEKAPRANGAVKVQSYDCKLK